MVLARRTGIPITLGLLYMVVAERLGLSLHGLNLPGHLMVGNNMEGVTNLLVDPFDGNACKTFASMFGCSYFWCREETPQLLDTDHMHLQCGTATPYQAESIDSHHVPAQL